MDSLICGEKKRQKWRARDRFVADRKRLVAGAQVSSKIREGNQVTERLGFQASLTPSFRAAKERGKKQANRRVALERCRLYDAIARIKVQAHCQTGKGKKKEGEGSTAHQRDSPLLLA